MAYIIDTELNIAYDATKISKVFYDESLSIVIYSHPDCDLRIKILNITLQDAVELLKYVNENYEYITVEEIIELAKERKKELK